MLKSAMWFVDTYLSNDAQCNVTCFDKSEILVFDLRCRRRTEEGSEATVH